jgi:leucyl-tRNA synthetase
MYGASQAQLAAALTDEVWDYVFLDGPRPDACGVPVSLLDAMRREFAFWYPFDVRVSGKDLIGNHLTFCMYNHTAIWKDAPGRWPKGVRCNGHLLLNGEKMSKSTGNFLTLQQAVAEYSADAVRIALADAGDGLDDANFEVATANAAILRLTKELAWLEELHAAAHAGQLRSGDLTFADKAFAADLDHLTHAAAQAYGSMQFREALKAAFFDLHNARDAYRLLCNAGAGSSGESGLHAQLALRYVDVQVRLLAPIAPHWCDHVWTRIMRRPGTVLRAGWPHADAPDVALREAAAYLHEALAEWRKLLAKAVAPPKKKPAGDHTSGKLQCTSVTAYVKACYTGAHACVLAALAAAFDAQSKRFTCEVDAALASARSLCEAQGAEFDPKVMLPFQKFKMGQTTSAGAAALQPTLAFDEARVLDDNSAFVAKTLGVPVFAVHVLRTTEDVDRAPAGARAHDAQPGKPAVFFEMAPLV